MQGREVKLVDVDDANGRIGVTDIVTESLAAERDVHDKVHGTGGATDVQEDVPSTNVKILQKGKALGARTCRPWRRRGCLRRGEGGEGSREKRKRGAVPTVRPGTPM